MRRQNFGVLWRIVSPLHGENSCLASKFVTGGLGRSEGNYTKLYFFHFHFGFGILHSVQKA